MIVACDFKCSDNFDKNEFFAKSPTLVYLISVPVRLLGILVIMENSLSALSVENSFSPLSVEN